MGSLVGGWDCTPGKAPKGFEDYKEPYTPRGRKAASPFAEPTSPRSGSGDMDSAKGPPSLARSSAPPMHCASAIKTYLTRASSGRQSPPTSPRAAATPRHLHLQLNIGDGDTPMAAEPLRCKEKWFSRVESAGLNVRPDVRDDESWRHGSFKVDDPCHAMHLPGSPRAAAAAAAAKAAAAALSAAADAPATPPAATLPVVPEQRVTAMRLPKAVVESFESSGL